MLVSRIYAHQSFTMSNQPPPQASLSVEEGPSTPQSGEVRELKATIRTAERWALVTLGLLVVIGVAILAWFSDQNDKDLKNIEKRFETRMDNVETSVSYLLQNRLMETGVRFSGTTAESEE